MFGEMVSCVQPLPLPPAPFSLMSPVKCATYRWRFWHHMKVQLFRAVPLLPRTFLAHDTTALISPLLPLPGVSSFHTQILTVGQDEGG